MSNAFQIWFAVSSLTLYVLPVRREIVYSLAVSTTWHGQPLKTYNYEDSASRWVGLFFLPLMPFDRYSKDRELDLIRNLETTFHADLSRDLEAADTRVQPPDDHHPSR